MICLWLQSSSGMAVTHRLPMSLSSLSLPSLERTGISCVPHAKLTWLALYLSYTSLNGMASLCFCFFLFKYSWFTMLCWFLLYSKVSHILDRHTFFSYSFPMWFITGYSRSLKMFLLPALATFPRFFLHLFLSSHLIYLQRLYIL